MVSEDTPRAAETAAAQTSTEPTPAPVAAPAYDYKPYQPYQPYPNPPEYGQLYAGQTVGSSQPNRGWEAVKTGIHVLIIVLAICGLGTGLSLVKDSNARTLIAANVPVLGVALLWSLAEVITRAIRKFKTGIYPALHIVVSLVIWLAVVILAGIFGFWFGPRGFDGGYCGGFPRYGFGRDGFFDGDWGDCGFGFGPVDSETSRAIATTAFTYTIAALYFILFIGACVDTIRYNRTPRPVVVVAPPAVTQWWQNWRPSSKDKKKPEQV